jgi:hypothetical protein
VLLSSEKLPNDGTPVPKHVTVLYLILDVFYYVRKLADVLINTKIN